MDDHENHVEARSSELKLLGLELTVRSDHWLRVAQRTAVGANALLSLNLLELLGFSMPKNEDAQLRGEELSVDSAYARGTGREAGTTDDIFG